MVLTKDVGTAKPGRLPRAGRPRKTPAGNPHAGRAGPSADLDRSSHPAESGEPAALPSNSGSPTLAPAALPDDVAVLIELVALRLRRAGVLPAGLQGVGSLMAAIERAAGGPLNGALADGDRALCRMAMREAHLRLTAWPGMREVRECLARWYAWLGGDPAAI